MISPTEVNESLNELRPYIEADGGYLEFVEIDYNLEENMRMYYGVRDGEEAAEGNCSQGRSRRGKQSRKLMRFESFS